MGHDTHFLSRLSRASAEHVELALSLYRDPQLLKEVLDRSKLPDGVERVALNLSPQGQGPYLVLQRNGHFVTCLGEGMTTGELPIISRARLDAAASQLAVLRERMQAAKALAGEDEGRRNEVIGRVITAGMGLSREEFLAQLAWAPMLMREYRHHFLRIVQGLGHDRAALVQASGRVDASKLLGMHARATWAAAHLAAIQLAEGAPREVLWSMWEEKAVRLSAAYFAILLMTNVTGVALRGVHALARIGKPMLPHIKAWHAEGEAGRNLDSASALLGIGLAHPKLAGEVVKLLERRTPGMERRLTEPEAYEEEVLGRARRYAHAMLREGDDPLFARAEDVPEDVAIAAYASADFAIGGKDGHPGLLVDQLFLSARRPAEALYLPAALASKLARSPDAETGAAYLQHWRTFFVVREPARRPDAPERNAPCSCGSGRKFKKCCGA